MLLAHKMLATTNTLPDSLKYQISNNFKRDADFTEIVAISQQTATSSKTTKSKYADSVNLRIISRKCNEFKKFFTDCEISMNQGFEMAVDYVIREARAGRINVSKSGITKIGDL